MFLKYLFLQIVCLTMHGLNLSMLAYVVWRCFDDVVHTTYNLVAPAIFRTLSDLCTLIQTCHLTYVLWVKPSAFLEIANRTNLKSTSRFTTNKAVFSKAVTLLCFGTTAYMFAVLYLLYGVRFSSLIHDLEIFENIVVLAIFKLFHVCSSMALAAGYALSQGIFLVLSISLYLKGLEFEQTIYEVTGFFSVFTNVVGNSRYVLLKNLKSVTSVINKTLGVQLAMFSVGCGAYIIVGQHLLMSSVGWLESCGWMYFVLAGIASLWIGSAFERKVHESSRHWLEQIYEGQNDLCGILRSSLQYSKIGVSCSLFSYTYAAIVSVSQI